MAEETTEKSGKTLESIGKGIQAFGSFLGPVGAIASAGMSIYQTINGMNRANKAEQALKDFKRQNLQNIADTMRVSTLGAEQQTAAALSRQATSVDALRSAGVRGVAGGLGAVEAQTQQMQRQISSDLDRQQAQIDQIRAQDEARIRQIQEARDLQDIQGMGAEIAAGRTMQQVGVGGVLKTGLAAFQMANPTVQPKTGGDANFKVDTVGSTDTTKPVKDLFDPNLMNQPVLSNRNTINDLGGYNFNNMSSFGMGGSFIPNTIGAAKNLLDG